MTMSRVEQLIRLQECFDSYNTHHAFKPGDVIELKPFLRNTRIPVYGQPIIVTEVLDTPFTHSTQEVGSPNFNMKLDIRCAVLDEDNELMFFYLDSSRYMPYRENIG